MNAKHPTFLTPPRSPSLAPDITDFGDTGPMDDEDPLQSTAEFVGTGDRLYRNYHPFLSGKSFNRSILLNNIKKYTHTYIAHPCDPDGAFLPPGAPPPPITEKSPDDWTPYGSRVEFELADYLFTKNQTPAHSIDQLLNIWAASLVQAGSKCTVFSDHRDLYKKIDNTPLGDVKWQSFSVKYTGAIPDEGALPWMEDSHDVWFRDPREVVRNMLANPDFATEMNLQPYREFATENHERQWKDFMSGDWSWAHAVRLLLFYCVQFNQGIYRTRYPKIPTLTAQHLCQSFSEVTKRLFQSQLDRTTTIHSMHLSVTFRTMCVALIAML
jgi:hypothetical protein